MQVWLLIGLGGFIGSIARFALSGYAQRLTTKGADFFPLGTLTVNVIGCFLIGLFIALTQDRWIVSPELRIALLVGLLGGFTTFSTYGYETLLMMQSGNVRNALLYFGASNALGLLLVWTGLRIGERF